MPDQGGAYEHWNAIPRFQLNLWKITADNCLSLFLWSHRVRWFTLIGEPNYQFVIELAPHSHHQLHLQQVRAEERGEPGWAGLVSAIMLVIKTRIWKELEPHWASRLSFPGGRAELCVGVKYWKVFLGFDCTDKHQADTRLTPGTTSDRRLSDTLALYGASTTALNISLRDTQSDVTAMFSRPLSIVWGGGHCTGKWVVVLL